MGIGKDIARIAKSHNICQEWHDRILTTKEKEELIEMYLKGIDFCMEYDFPPLDFVKKNFTGLMEEYGIYADTTFDSDFKKKVVVLGDCNGTVTAGGYRTCEVFVRHISRVKVMATDHAFVVVNVYDKAEVEISASDESKVCVYGWIKHPETQVKITKEGNARVKLIEKTL